MSVKGLLVLLVIAAFALPIAAWVVISRLPSIQGVPSVYTGGSAYSESRLSFVRANIGRDPAGMPWISNVQIYDADDDGRLDVFVCDASENAVFLYRNTREGWTEVVLARDVIAPAHVTVADLDADGDSDLIVSVLGNIQPDDKVVGSVIVLERDGAEYKRHVILDDVRRVADVQPADFDGDGDVDLAVAVFGYSRGQVLWLENRGGFAFREYELHSAPGTIHVPVSDYDGDGDPDIAAVVSQDEEEVWGFENLGDGKFKKRLIYSTINFDLGSAGLVSSDLDDDGDVDLILPVGDNLEDLDAYPQPYHGCLWLENNGDWDFQVKRIANVGGTYAAAVADLDVDGDQDVVLVSMANDWYRSEHGSLFWLENDGKQNFTTWQIDNHPTHLVTVACGDLDGDGLPDIVGGSLHIRGPYDRLGRVTVWLNQDSGDQ